MSATFSAYLLRLKEAAAPATPDTGEAVLYVKSDGLFYSKDDAGTETLVSGGAGGGGGISDGDTLATGLTFPVAGLHILDTNASHDLIISPGSDLTADRTLTVTTGDADRTLTISGNVTLPAGTAIVSGGALGTPSSGTLTSCTGLPLGGGGTGQTTAYAALDALTVQGADIASASTTNLATATGVHVNITGTTTITAHGTAAAGVVRILKFAGSLTYTHNATSLILPTAANITTAANDTAILVSLGSGNWRCVSYQRASGAALVGGGTTLSVVVLEEQQTSGTNGGTFTSGAWRTRSLNTEVADADGICSLSSNQFTLSAGTYIVIAIATAAAVDNNQIRIYNTTDSSQVLLGMSCYARNSSVVVSIATLQGIFTIGASKALELQHQCTTTYATVGFGFANSFGTEVYSSVKLIKVA